MKLSDKEIEVMLAKKDKDRYIYFIKKVVDNRVAWVLDDNGFAISSDNDDSDVVMLWPAAEYAIFCAIDDWSNYKAKEINLSYLMDKLLPDLLEKNIKLGIFMTPIHSGVPVIDAESLLLDLQSECDKYK